jgi:tetratricopeptide (TPR) repeat protein
MNPGALAAFDRAIAADPGFALAFAARARVQQLRGDITAARASMAAANALASGLPHREASHLAFFDYLISCQAATALAVLQVHLGEWPRDAMVLSTSASANGLIGSSGRVEQKRELLALMDHLAPSFGDDWWFTGYHAFALAENGLHEAAQTKIDQPMVRNPTNAYGAHTRAHLCYEAGDLASGQAFLRCWLATYPRDGGFYGHLSWHLALFELQAGDADSAFRLYSEAVAPEVNRDPAISILANAASFLWRWELAGQPHDLARWQAMFAFARKVAPRAGNAYADWHMALVEAAASDGDALETRVRDMEDLARNERYASGAVVPALARAFAAFQRQDFTAAIDAIEPVWDQRDRLVGSLAQTDLVEGTLLRAYVATGRLDNVRRLVSGRRARAVGIPVARVAAVH